MIILFISKKKMDAKMFDEFMKGYETASRAYKLALGLGEKIAQTQVEKQVADILEEKEF